MVKMKKMKSGWPERYMPYAPHDAFENGVPCSHAGLRVMVPYEVRVGIRRAPLNSLNSYLSYDSRLLNDILCILIHNASILPITLRSNLYPGKPASPIYKSRVPISAKKGFPFV